MSDIIFVDTETTGLDPARHQVIEVAWAGVTGPVRRFLLPHTLENAEPVALEVNQYYERGLGDEEPVDLEEAREVLRAEFEGKIFVGSNPSFDHMFLAPVVGEVWHHRKLDVTNMAMVMLGMDFPVGLAKTVDLLRSHYEYDLPAQDHTAVGDVLLAREIYMAVQEWRGLVV